MRYTTLTDSGHRALEAARLKIRELVDEVLEGHGPAGLPEPATDDDDMEAPDATDS